MRPRKKLIYSTKSKKNSIINFNELNLKLRNWKNDQLHAHQVIYQPNQPTKEGEPTSAVIPDEIYKSNPDDLKFS